VIFLLLRKALISAVVSNNNLVLFIPKLYRFLQILQLIFLVLIGVH
jgi:hypothetical protein